MTKERTIDQVCVREFRFRMLTKKTFRLNKKTLSVCPSIYGFWWLLLWYLQTLLYITIHVERNKNLRLLTPGP